MPLNPWLKIDQLYLRKVSKGGDLWGLYTYDLIHSTCTWESGQYYYPGAGTTSYHDLKPLFLDFPGGTSGKESACQCRGGRFNPWVGGPPREGNGNSLQHSCLENPMDRAAWWAIVRQVTKSQTRLKWLSSSSKAPSYLWREPWLSWGGNMASSKSTSSGFLCRHSGP